MKSLVLCFSTLVFLLISISVNLSHAQVSSQSETKYIVKFREDIPETWRAHQRSLLSAEKMPVNRHSKVEIWSTPNEVSVGSRMLQSKSEFIKYARRLPEIEIIEPDYRYRSVDIPNDPHFDQQWGLANRGQGIATPGSDIKALDAWVNGTAGNKVLIGLIDTGVDFGHEDLIENIWQNLAEDADGDGHTLELIAGAWQLDPGDLDSIDADLNGYIDDLIGWDFVENDNNPFDENGHGTHVAGIIGAKGNNAKGIAGVSWTASLMVLRSFDHNGAGNLSTILPAMAYAREMGARLTNNSWGGPSHSKILLEEIEDADEAGQLFVAAAGNQANNNTLNPVYPANYEQDNIITVAASDPNDALASFSNYGASSVDVVAPGVNIFSTLPGNQYGTKSGTSMAAPFVSGAACLIWAHAPEKSHTLVKDILLATVELRPGLYGKCVAGGRLDLGEAIRTSAEICEDWLIYSSDLDVKALANEGSLLWAATKKGLVRLNKADCAYHIFTEDNAPLPHDEITAVIVDPNGNKWMGVKDKALVKYDGVNWTVYDEDNSGFPGGRILGINFDQQNTLWIGTDKKGVVKFDGVNWTIYDKNNSGIPDNKATDFETDLWGKMWMTTNKGLTGFDGTNWIVYNHDNSALPSGESDKMSSLEIDSEGVKWIGTNKGLVKFDGTSWTIFTKDNSGIPDNKVRQLSIDQSGAKWLATHSGLARFDDSAWAVYVSENSRLPHNKVNALTRDQVNNTWVGTYKGINVFSAGVIAQFAAPQVSCVDEPIDFQNQSSGNASQEWQIDGVMVSTDQHFQHSFDSAGIYTVTLIASNGFSNDAISKVIRITPPPVIDLGPDQVVCAEAIVLDAGIDDVTYSWQRNGSGNPLSTERLFTVDQSESYRLTVTDVCGTTVQDDIDITLTSGCVWPGDVTADGKVNIVDFLNLGLADGISGPARPAATTTWQSETAPDWNSDFDGSNDLADNVNHKHADCDGSGTTDLVADGLVIRQNSNYSHGQSPAADAEGVSLILNHVGTIFNTSDTVFLEYEISLENHGGGDTPEIFGVALTLEYNLPIMGDPSINTNGTWMGPVANAMIHHNELNENTATHQINTFAWRRRTIDVGITGTGSGGTSGRGRIMTTGIGVVITEISEDPELLAYTAFNLSANNVIIIDDDGKLVPVNIAASSLSTMASLVPPADTLEGPNQEHRLPKSDSIEDFVVYPNPADQEVSMGFQYERSGMVELRIMNLMGSLVRKQYYPVREGNNHLRTNVQSLVPGIYLLEVNDGVRRGVKKLQIFH